MIAVKVVYNALDEVYEVYARRWWWSCWRFQKVYRYDGEGRNTQYYRSRSEAEALAVAYAKSLLQTKVIFKETKIMSTETI